MDGEKLPSYIIYKGAHTPRSLIKTNFKGMDACTKYDYRDGQLYTVQPQAWMDQYHMLDWVNCMWDQYTKGSRLDWHPQPVNHWEMYIGDFIGIVQGSQNHRRHIKRLLLASLDTAMWLWIQWTVFIARNLRSSIRCLWAMPLGPLENWS
jgi:hypothetical protein